MNGNGHADSREAILSIRDLKKYYPIHGGIFGGKVGDVRAVDGVTLSIVEGETLGLVGESGCGKSTLGRTVIRLEDPTDGQVFFEGRDMAHASRQELFQLRRDMQIIFQDPYSSLNPRMTVGEIVREPLVVHKIGTRAQQIEKVRSLLETVGLTGDMLSRYPHEFSGGQRQRIGIARALYHDPAVIVFDEATSALDNETEQAIARTIDELAGAKTFFIIAHRVETMRKCDRLLYLKEGRIADIGSFDDLRRRSDDFRRMTQSLGGEGSVVAIAQARSIA